MPTAAVLNRNNRPRPGEEGISILLLMLLIPTILGFMVILFNVANISLTRAQLRVAADAAAHAGAANICSRSVCWERSRISAIEILNLYHVQNNMGQPSDIQIDPSATGPTYTYGNLSVTIERGFWSAGTAGPGTFTSFENAGTFPGVPKFAAFNAIRVSLTRSNILLLLRSILPAAANWAGASESIAIASEVRVVNTAPFAIPICTLIDAAGEFDPAAACYGERLFTGADHYCPAGSPNCGVIPGFAWEPITPEARGIEDCNVPPLPNPVFACAFRYDTKCDFNSPHYQAIADHYGVVGVAGSGTIPTEQDVEDVIRTPAGTSVSAIGMPFSILAGGLTSVQSSDAIKWQMFSNTGNAAHPRYRDTPLRYIESNASYRYPYRFTLPNISQNPVLAAATICSNMPGLQDNNGVCNSNRRNFGGHTLLQVGTTTLPTAFSLISLLPGPFLLASLNIQAHKDVDAANAPVWSELLPVIADFGDSGQLCQGVSGAAAEGEIAIGSGHDWRIVGYIRGDIFDFDIGSPPPTVDLLGFKNGINPGTYKLSFDHGNCNMVRSKVRCGGDLVPISNPDGPRRVTLVR